ncbi:hypothetical protein EV01_1659 [Prochlorococcus marinus str. MIT 9401]|uniref:Uncharacterized protein n=1 Tax=Prochlorococcus marinus str. MIT 9401 TaxID=167551 RepID=A0A0A2B2E6_PROMR|nr:hypothetical protein EV01_1659 [Prochlorococcus marinus str. MIT 9401]
MNRSFVVETFSYYSSAFADLLNNLFFFFISYWLIKLKKFLSF